ncbi:MAG TPA: type VI secretion system tube protein Hcp [Polyangiales bacterium]|nr:type VI secretion system tube protein Hcp [Polyangiales bacterium]
MADIFLKIDDIKGESVVDGHKDEIDVLSWSWGMTQSGSSHVAGGSGTSKVSVRDITIVKRVDRSSPNLIKLCCNGKHFTIAALTVRKAGGDKPLEYFKMKLHNGLISSLTTGEVDQDGSMIETIGLNFAAFELEYDPQTKTGTGSGKVPAKWNIAKNSESVP